MARTLDPARKLLLLRLAEAVVRSAEEAGEPQGYLDGWTDIGVVRSAEETGKP